MPSGNTHAAMSFLAASGLLVVAYALQQPSYIGYGLAGGSLAGILITPDLDVDHSVRAHHTFQKHFGWLPGQIWRLIWWPYARLIPHRHWLSHAPVLSTLLRLAYLGGLIWILLFVMGLGWRWQTVPDWMPWAIAGLMASDIVHWFSDTFFSKMKRLL